MSFPFQTGAAWWRYFRDQIKLIQVLSLGLNHGFWANSSNLADVTIGSRLVLLRESPPLADLKSGELAKLF
jgi:phage gp46-like protein